MFKMVNGSSVSKEFPCNAGNGDLIPGLGITWRRKWQTTPVFLPEKNPVDRGAWWALVHGFARAGHDLVTKPPPQCFTIIKGKIHILKVNYMFLLLKYLCLYI
jgi:hypothetical protein